MKGILIGIIIILFIVLIYTILTKKQTFEIDNLNQLPFDKDNKLPLGYPYKITLPGYIYKSDQGDVIVPTKNYYGKAGPYQDFKLDVETSCGGQTLLENIYNM